MCGKSDKAMFELRRCAEMSLPNYLLFGSDPHLRPLRDHPEFLALMSNLRREYDQYSQEFVLVPAEPICLIQLSAADQEPDNSCITAYPSPTFPDSGFGLESGSTEK